MQILKIDLAEIVFNGNSEIIEKYRKILEKEGIKKIKCKNCGEFFIFNPKQPSEYCDNRLSNINMTCRQIGAQNKYKGKVSPIQKAYINALKNRNKLYPSKKSGLRTPKQTLEYENWKNKYSKIRDEFIKKYENSENDFQKNDILNKFKEKLKD